MIAELFLLSTLGAGAAGLGYLFHHNEKEKKAREVKRKEEESQFRVALLHELRKPGSTAFRLSEFGARCGMLRTLADQVAEEIYGKFYRKVVADGVITAEEQAQMSWLSAALELDAARLGQIEQRVKATTYRETVEGVLADGEITREEAAALDQLRRGLGISKQEAFRLTDDVSRSAYLATFRRVVRDGIVTSQEQQELLRWKHALALSDDQAGSIIRAEALALYRESFTMAMQDGNITPESEQKLNWLQNWAGLRDSDVAHYQQMIDRFKRLATYREGNPPSVRTRKLLEGGEICHWDRPCTLVTQTRTRSMNTDGELVVTSKNIIFTSSQKGLSYAPSKILDIVKHSDSLEIKVNGRQGSGLYCVSDADELEAILVGVVRKHKFLLSESYSSAKTRHIPDDVKREVWDRDGGRCTRCNATEYLEFDHIIPHTQGGANTVNNVQLLCRKCNSLKKDRI